MDLEVTTFEGNNNIDPKNRLSLENKNMQILSKMGEKNLREELKNKREG